MAEENSQELSTFSIYTRNTKNADFDFFRIELLFLKYKKNIKGKNACYLKCTMTTWQQIFE